MPEPEMPRLDVSIKRRGLPPAVEQLRLAGVADDDRNEQVARPRIEAHMATCRMIADALQIYHAGIADTTDLDLDGDSRQAAVWLMSGRCLGLLHALLVQIGAGICAEGS